MFQDAFVKLEVKDAATILDQVNPLLEGTPFDPLEATIMAHEAPFYPDYRFLDIADHSMTPAMRRFVLYKPGDVVVLDWTNEPIYDLNQRVPVYLTDENVTDYVRFFFSYVRGRHGRFIITESVEDHMNRVTDAL